MPTYEEKRLADAVAWAYRLFLGREPESPEVIETHISTLSPKTIEAVSLRFLSSPEHQTRQGISTDPIKKLLAGVQMPLRDCTNYPREPGFFRDLFGVRTHLSFLPSFYSIYSGGIPGDFNVEHLPMHDVAELKAMLEAAASAEHSFSVVELGAGWGPWVVMGASMARRRGLPVRLIAVEGSAEHVDFLNTHMRNNEIDPADHKIVHGVVGTIDGTVKFQKLSGVEYGATIRSEDSHGDDADKFDEVQSYSLATLLRDERVIDIIHCDIQGHEFEVLNAGMLALNAQVRRIVIGTHSRTIEEQLHKLFSVNGWRLIEDIACTFQFGTNEPVLLQDGAQFWTNPKFT